MGRFTKPFAKLSKKDANIAGGKGASLGEMLNAGIPVPDGFVVLSTTFDEFIKQAGIGTNIEQILKTVDHHFVQTVDAASERIQKLIWDTVMPEAMAAEVMENFLKMEAPYVAVRSSATAEDGADHAWAGQLDSYLNTTEAELLKNVQQCWASLFTPRAIFYRFEKGLNDTSISVAVVVQKMVDSEKSGIAFSVHPVTEDYNRIIIEAGLGLGEAIVSGSVTPDSYVVEKDTKKLVECSVNSQSRALYRHEGGGNIWKDLSPEEADGQVLSEAEISRLAEIIICVESHYGFPCDIEWAYERGKFYIVQSRPITTLPKLLRNGDGDEVDAGVVRALSKASEAKSEDALALAERFIGAIGGGNITKQEGNFSMLNFSFAPAGFAPYINRYYDFDFGSYVLFIKGKWGLVAFDYAPYIRTTDSAFKRFAVSKNQLQDMEDFKKTWKDIDMFYEKHTPQALGRKNAVELDAIYKKALDLYSLIMVETIFCEALDEGYVRSKYCKIIGSEKGFDDFFTIGSCPVFDSFALRSDQVMVKYADQVEAIQYIFADYSSVPDLEECRRLVKESLGKAGGMTGLAAEIKKIKKETRISQQKSVVYRENLSKELGELFDFMQLCMHVRDARKDPQQKIITAHYNAASALFEKLGLEKKKVSYAMGIDFTSGEYLKSGYRHEIDLREKEGVMYYRDARGTKLVYEGIENAKNVIQGALARATASSPEGELKGNIGFKGKVTGRCNIIVSEADFGKFKAGEILVTSMTRPEFVPLMKKAVAVITDEGGITCHAAIVSRELKLPCVIGTKLATRILKDGDLVEVDADSGVVRIFTE